MHSFLVANDPVLPQVELVLFYGPPCCGKTLYYTETLSASHTRVSARDTPVGSLHSVVRRVLALLLQGQNVAVDDENALPETRDAFIRAVKAKVV